jgi:hypothetical protein
VKLHCRLDTGSRTLLDLRSERFTVGADGSVEVYVYGAVSSTTDSSITVGAEDGSSYTCAFTPGPDMSKFPAGTRVKMHCHLMGGLFRLEYLKSDTAVVEIKL